MAKKQILVIAAHPDDAERHMGGTIAHLVRAGHDVTMLSLTMGQKGTFGDEIIRTQEFIAAAKIFGVNAVLLNFMDAEVIKDQASVIRLIREIRHYRPNVIFAPYPEFGQCLHGVHAHPDHIATGELVRHAVALANTKKVGTLSAHYVGRVLYYLLPPHVRPDVFVAISDEEMHIALRAVRAQVSQCKAYTGTVSLEDYLTALRRTLHRKYGVRLPKGYDLAEGFALASPLALRGASLHAVL